MYGKFPVYLVLSIMKKEYSVKIPHSHISSAHPAIQEKAQRLHARQDILKVMDEKSIPTILVDDTPVTRRGIADFIDETVHLQLYGQVGTSAQALALVQAAREEQQERNPDLTGWRSVICAWETRTA